jgi:MFS family permease
MKLRHLFRALRHRNYSLFFAGQGLSLIGTWIQQTGEVWLAYRLTHSAFYLGLTGFASQLPTLLLAPIAGAIVDRTNRQKLLIWSQALAMLQAFALAALVLSHRITYPQLILLSVFSGMIDAVEIPVRQSSIVLMVENKTDLSNAIALNSSLVNMARLVGPSIAGLLIAAVGEGWCFLINGLSYMTVIVALFAMKLRSTAPVERETAPLFNTLREGFLYAVRSVPIASLLGLLALVSLMASSYSVLLPIFATQVLGGGPNTLGFLMAGTGVGALGGALYLAQRPNVLGLTRVIARGITLFGACLFLFSFSRHFALSWFLLLGGGFGMMSSTASINTMLQTIVDEDKRGRVMSLFTMAFIGMAPLGNLFGGWIAQRWSAAISVRIAGAWMLVGAAVFIWRRKYLGQHIRPIYARLGIIPAVAAGLRSATANPRQ